MSALNHSIRTMHSLPLIHITPRLLQSTQSLSPSTNNIYGSGRSLYLGSPQPHCNRAQPNTSMVPPTRSPSFLSANYPPDQPFTRIFHQSDTKSEHIFDLYQKSPLPKATQTSGLSQQPLFLLVSWNGLLSVGSFTRHSSPINHLTSSVTRRPVCLPPNRLHHSCTHSPLSHSHAHAHNRSIRHCLDFRKAFDTIWHSTLWVKLAHIDMPDNVYNWMVDYFSGHSHCTQYGGQT